MDIWSECLDSFLVGLVAGLGIAIIIAVTVFKIDLYLLEKENIAYQQEMNEQFEKQRLEIEGWVAE